MTIQIRLHIQDWNFSIENIRGLIGNKCEFGTTLYNFFPTCGYDSFHLLTLRHTYITHDCIELSRSTLSKKWNMASKFSVWTINDGGAGNQPRWVSGGFPDAPSLTDHTVYVTSVSKKRWHICYCILYKYLMYRIYSEYIIHGKEWFIFCLIDTKRAWLELHFWQVFYVLH